MSVANRRPGVGLVGEELLRPLPTGAVETTVLHRLLGAFGIECLASRWLGVQEIAVGQEWVTGPRPHFDDVCAVGIGRPRERRLEGPDIVIVQRQDVGGTFEEDPDVGILERRGKAGGPAENDPRVS